LDIIALNKPPKMQMSFFNFILGTFIHIIGDFNMNLLTKTIQSSTLHTFMN